MTEIKTQDFFDRAMAAMTLRPDIVRTEVSVLRDIDAYGNTQTFTVQTFRAEGGTDAKGRRSPAQDTVFIEHTSAEHGFRRFVLLPKVADIVARQRETTATKMRRRGAAKAKETKAAKLGFAPAEPDPRD
jgi:hypothetical protein